MVNTRDKITRSQVPAWLFFLCIILPLSLGSLKAIEIPFFAGFYSDNHVSYYPERDIREFDWDEKYRLSFGVDSLRFQNMGLGLKLVSQPNFIEQQVLMDSLALSWIQENFTITGMTRPHGMGHDYFFQQLYVADPSYNSYLYDQTRFNGLEATWLPANLGFQGGFGGNTHNQAMGFLSLFSSHKSLSWVLRLDGKARDTHWTTANLTPSFALSYSSDMIRLRTDTAFKYVFAHEDRQSHQEFFHVSEARLDLKNLPELIVSLDLTQRDYAPRQSLRADAGFNFRFSRFTVVPAYHYFDVDEIEFHRLDCLACWNPRPQISIGVYASHEYPLEDQNRFTLGLQSSLRFDF